MRHRLRKQSPDRFVPALFGAVDTPLRLEGDLQDNHSDYAHKPTTTTSAANSNSMAAAAEQGAEQVAEPSRLQEAEHRFGSPRTRFVEGAGAVSRLVHGPRTLPRSARQQLRPTELQGVHRVFRPHPSNDCCPYQRCRARFVEARVRLSLVR